MGCDIHCFMEHRHETSERWSSFGGRINPGRNYRIFARLAGVRRDDPPVIPVRGMPTDAGWAANDKAWLWISDTPSAGYATPADAARWAASGCKYRNDRDGKPQWIEHPDWHTHSWAAPDEWEKALADDPSEDEYFAMLAAMRELEKRGLQVRVVFWFDN